MLQFEFLKLWRNNLTAVLFGYIGFIIVTYNVLVLVFKDAVWMEAWSGKIAILIVSVMVDIIFWLAAMQIAEDMETGMIHLMRTSRNIVQYFAGKHVLLLLIMGVISIGIMASRLSEPMLVLQFTLFTLLTTILMISAGVFFTMLVKKQNSVMVAGSVVTGLLFATLMRLLLPTWNIPAIPGNPFNYIIKGLYDLLYPFNGSYDAVSLVSLSLFTFIVYLFFITLFYWFTYKKGFRL
ncbi:hypothetical protein U9J35_03855 [Rossellomorea aquimaris]|nr:hypothetical protein [Rossellomorea aquimaris]WRP07311.1 hypothetical protein U9J35_03855 [Rossellomorea aquimaris]